MRLELIIRAFWAVGLGFGTLSIMDRLIYKTWWGRWQSNLFISLAAQVLWQALFYFVFR